MKPELEDAIDEAMTALTNLRQALKDMKEPDPADEPRQDDPADAAAKYAPDADTHPVGLPQCPHCTRVDTAERITFNAGVANSPQVSRARWKCSSCTAIFDVTSSPGQIARAQVIRPGRIP